MAITTDKADEILDGVKAVKTAHENMNSTFSEIQKELEGLKGKQADALTKDALDKMTETVTKQQDALDKRLDAMEVASKRAALGMTEDGADDFQKARHFFTITKMRRGELPAGEQVKDSDVDLEAYKAYSGIMDRYLRKGERMFGPDEMKALSVGSDPDGGYTVTPEMSNRIIQRQFETTPLRQLATIETISGSALDLLEDPNEFTANWVAEVETNANTATGQIGKRQIVAHQLEARPKATQQLLDDAGIDMEAWTAGKVADKFSRAEANAFVLGDGVGKPRGMTTYTAGTTWGTVEQVASGANGSATYAGLTATMSALKEFYQGNASWLLRRELVGKILALTSSSTPLWIPSIAVGQPSTLLGAPVRMAADFATLATNSLSGAFGDFRAGYTIVDRMGVRLLRDPYTAKPYVEFYTTKRVGGDVVDFDAIKLLKLAA